MQVCNLSAEVFQGLLHKESLESLPKDNWRISAAELQKVKLPEMLSYTSSGTENKPKKLKQPSRGTLQEAQTIAEQLNLCEHSIGELICCAPLTHLYGLVCGLALAYQLKTSLTFQSLLTPWKVPSKNSLVVALPAVWPQLVKIIHKHNLQNLRIIHSSGALNHKLVEQLCKEKSIVVAEIFGASETGALGFRVNSRANQDPWTLFKDVAFSNPQIGKEQMLAVEGIRVQKKCVTLNDRVLITERNKFVFLGRSRNLIKPNGILINLEEKTQMLQRHFGEAVVCLLPVTDPIRGEGYKLFLSPETIANEDLTNQILASLDKHKPNCICSSKELHRSSLGKFIIKETPS